MTSGRRSARREAGILYPIKTLDLAKKQAIVTWTAGAEPHSAREGRATSPDDAAARPTKRARPPKPQPLEQAGDHALAAAVMEEQIAAPQPIVHAAHGQATSRRPEDGAPLVLEATAAARRM